MKPSIQAGFDALAIRLEAYSRRLESTIAGLSNRVTTVSGSTDSAITTRVASLSGTIDSAVVSLSGTANARFNHLSASLVAVSGVLNSGIAALSGTTDAAFIWAGADHRRGSRYFDDFYTDLTMHYGVGGTGGAASLANSAVSHPGILNLACAASASYAAGYVNGSAGQNDTILGDGAVYYEAMVKIATISNGTDNIAFRTGICEIEVTPPDDGIWFECDRSRFGNNNWRLTTAVVGTRVATDTGVAPSSATWTRLRFEVAPAANAVTGSIDGVVVATLSANIPFGFTTDMQPNIFAIKTLGANGRSVGVDYIDIRRVFTTPR